MSTESAGMSYVDDEADAEELRKKARRARFGEPRVAEDTTKCSGSQPSRHGSQTGDRDPQPPSEPGPQPQPGNQGTQREPRNNSSPHMRNKRGSQPSRPAATPRKLRTTVNGGMTRERAQQIFEIHGKEVCLGDLDSIYRHKAKTCHPDKAGRSAEEQRCANAEFRELKDAHDVLVWWLRHVQNNAI